jgi:hypothetical protein
MPPKDAPNPAPPPDVTAAALESADASASETLIGSAGDAVSSQPQVLHQSLSDAVFALLGLPLEKLEEQLQGLK